MWSYATSQTRSGRSGSQLRSFPRFQRLLAPGALRLLLRLGPVAPRVTLECLLAQRGQLGDELLPRGIRERRGDADVVEYTLVVVEAQEERADHRARALLVPAEAGDHAVRGALVL